MAGTTEYKVFWGVQQAGGGGPPNQITKYTKAEAEALVPTVTEEVEIFGPIFTGKWITVKAETAAMAAKFVDKVICGPSGVTGVYTKATELHVGTASKSSPTVKTTEWKEEPVI